MNLNTQDKVLLDSALKTEIARVKRAANAQCSQGIKDILGAELQSLMLLQQRIYNEPVKEVAK